MVLVLKFLQDVDQTLGISLFREQVAIVHRVNHEGFSFLSKTLPTLIQWCRKCQEDGQFKPCPGFKSYRTSEWNYPYPEFLHQLWAELSDARGVPLVAITPEDRDRQGYVYTAISTICQSFGSKYEIPLSAEILKAQIRDSVVYDNEEIFDFGDLIDMIDDVAGSQILDYASQLVTELFEPYEHVGVFKDDDGVVKWGNHTHEFDVWRARPKHGSGSVAYPCKPHEKYNNFMGFPPNFTAMGDYRTLQYLPGEQMQFNFASSVQREISDLAQGGFDRMSIVPKNSKSGRIIGLMMKELMFPQQWLRDAIYELVESHPLTAGRVWFHDQSANQRLAIDASVHGDKATVDLRRASDSVGRVHVDELFKSTWVLELLNDLRSRYTRAVIYTDGLDGGPDKEVEEVLVNENHKYAPMGSALCFPVEAIVFWALTTSIIHYEYTRNGETQGSCAPWKNVWVYGDDLIFPNEYYEAVVAWFGRLRLTINEDKSFHKGKFRESCGVDAYFGIDVTPCTRISTRLPIRTLHKTNKEFAESVVAWIEYANTFERNGFPSVAKKIRQFVCTEWPSAKSYPRLTEEYNGGGLFFLDYDGWKISEYFQTMRDEEDRRGRYYSGRSTLDPSYDPDIDGFAPQHVLPNFYQGKINRVWDQSISHYRADITENVRRLRYYSEGSSDKEGSWFVDKSSFELKRKTQILT
jgi:hypothetical protein